MAASRALRRLAGGGGRGAGVPRPPAVIWLPALLVAAVVMLPAAYLVLRTLGAGGEAWDLVWRARTAQIMGRSLILMVLVTGGAVAVSLPLGWLTVRTDLPLRRFWEVATSLPLVIPSYVAGFVVVAALGPKGMAQQLLGGPLGLERFPEIYGLPGAALAIGLVSYPYVLLTVRAALRGLDPAQEEVSRSLGHGSWETFLRVTLPQLRPAVAAGALLVALYTLADFGGVSLLRYETFTWAIYLQYQTAIDRTLAAALSLVFVAVALVLLVAEARSRGRGRYHRTAAGARRLPSVARLGRWRWPAVAFCSLVVLLALVMPVGVLAYWLVRGMGMGEPLRIVWGPALSSVSVSAAAAAVTVAAALPAAVLAVRYPSRLSSVLERGAYMGFALPGIVVALALVFFGANFATPIYQTLGLLIVAYGVLFLPQALGSSRTSLMQVSPRLEEAARSLGRRPWQVLISVTIPLMGSGLLAGATLVFLTVMKELPATLLLSPIGFRTLATSIWSATSEALFARAAAPALLLVLVSAVPMAFFIARRKDTG